MANQGTTFEYGEIPADLRDEAEDLREFMVEAAAEATKS